MHGNVQAGRGRRPSGGLLACGAAPLELGAHERGVNAVAVLPDGRAVSGGRDGRVRLWDPATPEAVAVEVSCQVAHIALDAGSASQMPRIVIAHGPVGLSVWSVGRA